jgi:hypothetical protein
MGKLPYQVRTLSRNNDDTQRADKPQATQRSCKPFFFTGLLCLRF